MFSPKPKNNMKQAETKHRIFDKDKYSEKKCKLMKGKCA